MKVSEVMSRPVITVTLDTPIKDAARLLIEHGISTLPVLDSRKRLVGVVCRRDLVRVIERRDDVVASELVRRLAEPVEVDKEGLRVGDA